MVTGRPCKAKCTENQPHVSQTLFPGCRTPLIPMGPVPPDLYSHIFQSIPSSLRDTLFHTDRWARSPPHSPFPMGHLPAQPQARREPRKHRHWAPATAMNVVLQVLPHPAPEANGQIRIVAEVGAGHFPGVGLQGEGREGDHSGLRGR